jgi:hypothetical protein
VTLTWRVTTSVLEQALRPLKPDEGKVDVLGTDDGGFVSVDRASGNNTYTLTPPPTREPLRQEAKFHVARYEEDLVSQTGDEWQVEIEFVRGADRGDTPTADQPVSGAAFPMTFDAVFRVSPSAWGFTTPLGTLTSDRVDANVVGTGEGGVKRFNITARFTKSQAHVFEAAYARLGGGRVREVPDAANVAVDDTTDDAVTVEVDAPGSAEVPDGAYIVTRWESRRLTDAYQELDVTIAAKD